MRTSATTAAVAFASLAAAGHVAGQAPALSGLAPTPTPHAVSPGDATPTPTPTSAPKLTRIGAPTGETANHGQSLADVVRSSKEARKGQAPKKSLGTITNENLRTAGAAASTSGAPPKAGAKAGAVAVKAADAAATPFPTYDVARDDVGRSEADWRSRMNHARAMVADGEARVSALDTKAKQLENDFYAQSDGYRRDGVIKPAWDQARDDLAKARAALDEARKSIDDLQEEARRSNTPPGWLR